MNNRSLSYLAMMSGDEPTETVGHAAFKAAQQQEAAEARQRSERQRLAQPINLGNGFLFDPSTGKASQDPAYAQHVSLEHDRRMELARMQTSGQNRLSASERKSLADMDSQLQLGTEIKQLLPQNADAIEPYADTGTELVKGVFPALGNLIEGSHKLDSELDVLNKMRRFIAGIRKSELGSALTGYELNKAAEWDPTYPGITFEESQRRFNNIYNDVSREYEALRGGRTLEGGGQKAAASEPASAPTETADQEWTIGPDGKPVRVR